MQEKRCSQSNQRPDLDTYVDRVRESLSAMISKEIDRWGPQNLSCIRIWCMMHAFSTTMAPVMDLRNCMADGTRLLRHREQDSCSSQPLIMGKGSHQPAQEVVVCDHHFCMA
ncbi:hypothetical protein WJX77_007220 [Trebouxia sp. C0004]